MSRIIVFGAGGRAGGAALAQARRRGHQVTAVVRDPGKYPGLAADGVAVDAGDFPAEWRAFALAHDAGTEVFRTSPPDLDWVVVTPPMRLDESAPNGRYRVGGALLPGSDHLSYADLAVALLDEVETPKHHREQIAVAD